MSAFPELMKLTGFPILANPANTGKKQRHDGKSSRAMLYNRFSVRICLWQSSSRSYEKLNVHHRAVARSPRRNAPTRQYRELQII